MGRFGGAKVFKSEFPLTPANIDSPKGYQFPTTEQTRVNTVGSCTERMTSIVN